MYDEAQYNGNHSKAEIEGTVGCHCQNIDKDRFRTKFYTL